jgi:hypothetical protein
MHLNDDELLELSELGKLHLESCSSCKQRADNLVRFRDTLSNLPTKKVSNENWGKLKLTYELTHKESQLEEQKKRNLTWRYISVALAASLLFVVITYGVMESYLPVSNNELEIAYLIKQNELLQEALFIAINKRKDKQQALAAIRYKIGKLDADIQNAYFQKSSAEKLSHLWSNKLMVLNTYLIKEKNDYLIKI